MLYQKKHKGYMNKSNKMQIWNNIGTSLVPAITGVDAEKQFYRLRQKFGKERRKVVQSQARSGAGADHMTYTSNWELYDDLMFLADHIQSRRTTSNFQRSVLTQGVLPSQTACSQLATSAASQSMSRTISSSQRSASVQSLQRLQLATHASSTHTSTPLLGDENIDLQNKDLYKSLSGSELTIEDESTSEVDSMESCFTSNTLAESSDSSNTASKSKAMTSAIVSTKTVPSADIKKRKRQKSLDEVDTIMMESSKNISSLADTLSTVLKKNLNQSQPDVSSEVQIMIGSLAVELSKVPEESQMFNIILFLHQHIYKKIVSSLSLHQ